MRLALIPARGGSVRIPRKNIRPFRGRPIIEYSIAAARACPLFGAVLVSTDDDEIADVSRKAGAFVHRRANDDGTRGTQEVACAALFESLEFDPEQVCVIYATCPMLRPVDLHRGWVELERRGATYAMSVQAEPLADAGCYYWGSTDAFRRMVPLIAPHTVMVPLQADRTCDINTPEDWARAESMFDALKL